MCDSCWREAGSPTEKTPETDRLIELIGELYEIHVTGGPMHSVLDNWNLDGRIEPYWAGWSDEDLGASTRALCTEIASLLNGMTEPQRYAALAYADGFI